MKCELDNEQFTCCKCNGTFDVTQGTWLPIEVEECGFMQRISPKENEPRVFNFNMRPPEVITSDKFTCYDCL